MSATGGDLVFLFSLPRSGSTLTQRLIAAHPDVATAAEPWILLPFLYALREDGVYAEYGHRMMAWAIDDYLRTLPDGRARYLDGVRRLTLELYREGRGDARYFLDKTPRYHLVVEEILELFPDARAVFLWRQPQAIAASVIDTFGEGRWNLDKFAADLTDGLARLVAAYRRHADRSVALRFEDVVADPAAAAAKIFEYLQLDPAAAPAAAATFGRVSVAGRMGDPHRDLAAAVRPEPLEKWRATMANPLRRRWCSQYLRWIGADRLATMGYDLDELLTAVGTLPAGWRSVPSDVSRIALGHAYWGVADRLSGVRRRPFTRVRVYQSSGP